MKSLQLIQNDLWLEPYRKAIEGRYHYFLSKEKELTQNGKISLSEFASGYLYFGLHPTAEGWVFREWAPGATAIYLIGDFNNWEEQEFYRCNRIENGIFEIHLPAHALHHEDLYKLKIHWEKGEGERIPAWVRRVVQDERTKIFSAQVWAPKNSYQFKNKSFTPNISPLLIYECHIGMASNEEKVGSYGEFTRDILPRIKNDGYNAIQIMAIQEHPYYGSFGYHVSSFFAASSRFGTPEELKELIDTAHSMGIAVIMDIVHSHAVKNEIEGLGRFDGTYTQYFHEGGRREHPAWDSLCFDYGKNEVLHFLLSNCKFWLEEYRFDGFRFDGVTSMLYHSHGLGEAFSNYGDYYNGNQDGDAVSYLTLANQLIHQVNEHAITIAEEVSGMPGLAAPVKSGGYGFDYRMAMNIPDYWIKIIKEKQDQDWPVQGIWWETTNRRADEKTVSYAESHDQALVGDKTIIFRLIDSEMYWHMMAGDSNMKVDRGIALHKMIRLVTASTINGAYLNFMGNEFGHPEWIDFPRDGNGWSHKYARRQWNLVDNPDLKYRFLGDFDKAMIHLIGGIKNFQTSDIHKVWDNDKDKILAFRRENLLFVFNFNPVTSFTGYGFLVPPGKYRTVLNTDHPAFGGFGLNDDSIEHFTLHDALYAKEKKEWLKLYLPARTARVLEKIHNSLCFMLYPLKFEPILKEIIWGGDEICRFKNLHPQRSGIGESWELSHVKNNISIVANGELKGKSFDEMVEIFREKLLGKKIIERFGTNFPLLIKFIDARDALSVQVHPDDLLAKKRHNSFGKTEMWYVVNASPGAYLYSGFAKSITPEEYLKSLENDTFVNYLQRHEVKSGDVFFLPAGRVHAIGAGCFIAEIQQTSDITYRIYDYNRRDANGNPRELHTELAKDAIDYKIYSDYKLDYIPGQQPVQPLVSCPYFTTNLIEGKKGDTIQIPHRDSFSIFICLEGNVKLTDENGYSVEIRQGETVLLPAENRLTALDFNECGKLLETYV